VSADDTLPELARIAAAERAALVSGDYAALPGILARKQRAAAAFAAGRPPRSDAVVVLDLLRENQGLIDAARAGFTAARERLTEIARGPGAFSSYADDGRMRPLAQEQAGFLRRY